MNMKQMRTTINALASEYQERPVVLTGLEKYSRNQLLTILLRLRKIVNLKSQADAIAQAHRWQMEDLGHLETYRPDWYVKMKDLNKQAKSLWKDRYDWKNF